MREAARCPARNEARAKRTRPADEAEGGEVGIPKIGEPFW